MSTNAKHTREPWEVVATNQFGPFCIRMPTPAGSKHPTHYGVREIGTIEDAHLIAAAPDMYEAGHSLIREFDNIYDVDDGRGNIHGDLMDLVDKLRAALKKAEA